jgi:NADPH:quinone reductase-like Zn-dependent oxidoreductase
MQALVFEQTGEAREVLNLCDDREPVPAAGEVLVAVEASPVHPADFSFVRGTYRVKPAFPQVAGLSGAGRVVSAGAGVRLAPGTRVAFRWPGAWAELALAPLERVYTIPDSVATDAAAQFVVNPITAWGLLEAARVGPGDCIALTAASSSVAALVSVLAAERGVRVIGIAREASLGELGRDVLPVAESTPALGERVRELAGGRGVAALVDCVGGPLAGSLFSALAPGGTVVAYGTLSPEPVAVRNGTLIYGNLTWFGFGIDRFLAGLSAAESERMFASLWAGVASGRLPLPVQARAPLAGFSEALRMAAGGGRGKVIFENEPRGAE